MSGLSKIQPALSRLQDFLTRLMAYRRTPGMALALFDANDLVHVMTIGHADPEQRAPLARETLFQIGSITKSFTALAIVQAVELGRLDLHAPVTHYLPWFRVQTQYSPVTLHHLLTHSAGLIGITDRSPDIRAAVWALRETEAAWAPGERFWYSDAGYQILALVLERLTGQTFAQVLHEQIFQPLGMANSFGAVTHALRPRLARGYQSIYDDRPAHRDMPLIPAPFIEMSAGDCSIACTVEDMARYGRMLLNRGVGPGGKLLSEAGFARLSQPLMSIRVQNWEHYGYGIAMRQYDGFRHFGHGGGTPGFAARLIVDADNGLGLALLSTTPSQPDAAWAILSLYRCAILGQPLDAVDLALPDPTTAPNATDYAGTYHAADGASLTVIAAEERLYLSAGEAQELLENRGEDCFYAPHPDFDRFLLVFKRNDAGRVVEVCHGGQWYFNEQYTGPRRHDHPPEWNAYPGHYRAHNPWQTNFRVILRKAELWLVWPAGDEEILIPLGEGVFQVGDGPSPERLRFDQIVDGQALCANLSACDYYRFFTP